MIERLIYTLLKTGLDEMKADPGVLERYFLERRKLGADEVAAIVAFFAEHPPTIIHNYARQDSVFPLWSIVLADESETQGFLGREGGVVGGEDGFFDEDDPDAGLDESAYMQRSTFHVFTYSDHPDVTIWYYHLAKFLLARGTDWLLMQVSGVDINLSGGDIAPDAMFIPSHLFARRLTLSVEYPEVFAKPRDPLNPKSTTLAPIFWNDTLTDKTNVTVVGTSSLVDVVESE